MNDKYIQVSRERFNELFGSDRYISRRDDSTMCSMYYFDVIDTVTNGVVGFIEESSYGIWYYIIPEVASKEDIIKYYEDKLEKEKQFHKSMSSIQPRDPSAGPGLMTFLEGENIVKYSAKDFSVDVFFDAIKR